MPERAAHTPTLGQVRGWADVLEVAHEAIGVPSDNIAPESAVAAPPPRCAGYALATFAAGAGLYRETPTAGDGLPATVEHMQKVEAAATRLHEALDELDDVNMKNIDQLRRLGIVMPDAPLPLMVGLVAARKCFFSLSNELWTMSDGDGWEGLDADGRNYFVALVLLDNTLAKTVFIGEQQREAHVVRETILMAYEAIDQQPELKLILERAADLELAVGRDLYPLKTKPVRKPATIEKLLPQFLPSPSIPAPAASASKAHASSPSSRKAKTPPMSGGEAPGAKQRAPRLCQACKPGWKKEADYNQYKEYYERVAKLCEMGDFCKFFTWDKKGARGGVDKITAKKKKNLRRTEEPKPKDEWFDRREKEKEQRKNNSKAGESGSEESEKEEEEEQQ